MYNQPVFNSPNFDQGNSNTGTDFGDGLNWPWSGPVPNIDGNDGSTPSISSMEEYLDYLFNNAQTTTTYDSSLKALQYLMALGRAKQDGALNPSDLANFNKIVGDIQTTNGVSVLNGIINMAMMGSFYKNGATDFGDTNAFCSGLASELNGLAGVDPLFAQLSLAATKESNYVQGNVEQNFVTTPDGSNTEYTTDSSGNIIDFEHYVEGATAQIGNMVSNSNMSQWVNNYYAVEAGSIVDQCKGNPGLALIMLMVLLMGSDNDMTRNINGYGAQLKDLTSGQNTMQQILTILRESNPSTADIQTMMQDITSLDNQVDAYDPSISSSFDQQIQGLLSGQIPITADANGQIDQYNSTGGVFDFNGAVPSGVTVFETENGKQVQIYPPQNGSTNTKVYIPAGAQITLKGTANTAYPFTLSQLGLSDMVSGTNLFNSLGDFTQVVKYFGANATNILQTMMSAQTTLNSPSSMIQTQIQTETATKSSFEALMKAGFDTETNTNQSIQQNMSRAGE